MRRNPSFIGSRLACGLLSLLALSVAPAMATGAYYVAPSGSDANTGGIGDPFLTIPRAQTALRAAGGGTVYLRGGTYTLASTVVFNEQDSNSTYQAYTGEVPIISGGVVLNNWALFSGDIYRASVNWNFRGLFKDGVRLNYKNPVTYARTTAWSINVTFTDSPPNPASLLVSAGDWVLDYANGFVYYKTGGGAPTGTIVAGSVGKLFQITGTETTKVANITFDHLYFFYNNWLIPGTDDTTYTDNWIGTFSVSAASCGVTGGCAGAIPGAVEVEFANNATFRSCRIAHNASDGIAFGRGVINSQVVGSEVWDNGSTGIVFGFMGNTGTGGWVGSPWPNPNGQTLTYAWYGNANWIEDNNVATDNYVYNNGQTFPTTININANDLSNLQINYNRTDNTQFDSISAFYLYGTFKADYNHISNTNLNYWDIPDGAGIYSASGQECGTPCNVGIPGEYIGNLVHDTYGFGPLYIDQSNDQYTVNNNVTYNVGGAVQPNANPLMNNHNNATLSGNNIGPTQAQIDAAVASTGPRAPYYADLFGGSDVTVTFADRPDAQIALTGSYGGIDWGSQLWYTNSYLGTHYVWINSGLPSQVTQTFTLPAGTVLKSFNTIGGGTVIVQSSGNPDQTYSGDGTHTTGWTTAAAVVTINVTNASGAWGTSFTNIVYGNPPSYGTPATAPLTTNTLVSFLDRPATNAALTGLYGGINWGMQSWYTDVYAGVHEAWINNSSTSQVTQTFTLPAGKVLKGLKISAGTVIVQSNGNPDRTYSPTAGWTTYTTGWTTASATVTIKVTNPYGAWSSEFTNIVYGNP